MRKIISYILIIAGILIILLPKAKEWHYERQQKQLLEQMEAYSTAASQDDSESMLEAGNERLSKLFNQAASQETGLSQVAHSPEEDPYQKEDEHAVAIIKIDKIDLKLPVLEGASQQNMKFAAAHMTETTPLDQIGNAAIAAHRAQTKGRLFNRLNELKVGDDIILQIKEKEVVYTVFNVSIVEPTDTSVLKRNDTDRVLTLITCDPVINATHRLIVQAKPS